MSLTPSERSERDEKIAELEGSAVAGQWGPQLSPADLAWLIAELRSSLAREAATKKDWAEYERVALNLCTCDHAGGHHDLWNRCMVVGCDCACYCTPFERDKPRQVEMIANGLYNPNPARRPDTIPEEIRAMLSREITKP